MLICEIMVVSVFIWLDMCSNSSLLSPPYGKEKILSYHQNIDTGSRLLPLLYRKVD